MMKVYELEVGNCIRKDFYVGDKLGFIHIEFPNGIIEMIEYDDFGNRDVKYVGNKKGELLNVYKFENNQWVDFEDKHMDLDLV